MIMRFSEIGQRLRAYRLESGLRAEEIAARLGVSRAALYRYEKGEVIKLDTVQRLAELLQVSPLSLLGVSIEYQSRPVGYFERARQIEENAAQLQFVGDALCHLTMLDETEAFLAESIISRHAGRSKADRLYVEQLVKTLKERRAAYAARRPNLIAMLSPSAISIMLQQGIGGPDLSEELKASALVVARREVEHMANLLETEPMGLQFGLLSPGEINSRMVIARSHSTIQLVLNPFHTDTAPDLQEGVAIISSAEEIVVSHQKMAEMCWKNSIKGHEGAKILRSMLG
ncbi:HTH DNA-binding protein [Granulibacter bethesdensis]|uniref:HTH DNA-binding protein n=1 Tax=Granulibacter bethesdensis (strain ATCC BAA-1260 / CGDNIH1) TaxID=391165 RepID=Q0BTI2_GRABC|nr:HTH DNA-binding protein [Granulibacter bethesdensis CGDNIH1]AHJ69243.1 HTH DNA-binding protein [Granulibacter bethesdensis]APH51682.1 HTH DNA-binding protein [Granulibacter bethesdensis]APH64375.1 HTH DNA-binding protein [Granulibacter bethesdensis]